MSRVQDQQGQTAQLVDYWEQSQKTVAEGEPFKAGKEHLEMRHRNAEDDG